MNILFDATVFEIPFTGVAKSTLLLYENCYEIDPHLFLNGFIKNETFSELPNIINLHKLQKNLFSGLYSKKSISQVVKKLKPDVIHFPWHGNIPCKFNDAMTVMTLHDVLPLEIPNYLGNSKQKKLYINKIQKDIDRCDVVFTDSFYSKKQIKKIFHVVGKIIVNYLAPTLSKCKSNTFKKPDFQYFIYVGGYAPRKGLDSLVKAFFSLYENKKTKCKLLFIGNPGPISRDFQILMEKGKKLGIVEERGYISDDELSFLLSNAVALLYLSKYEGFGLPPLDAMNVACPVITTNYSSIPEICGDAVIYVEPDDIEAVAKKMLLLENSNDLRDELRDKGLIQASSFSWGKTAKIFLDNISK
ncbi:MAG: glycosyltransferase family 4 protein [Paludibacteraceae bacterium]